MQQIRPAGQEPAQPSNHYRMAIAQPSDIPSLQEAAGVSWRATYAGIFTPEFIDRFLAQAYSTESLERALHNPRTQFVVAKQGAAGSGEESETVIGFCQAGPPSHAEHAPPQGGELYRLYVRPEWQRRGIGSRLLLGAEAWLAVQGYVRYGVYVHARNEQGKAFYWQMGFDRLRSGDLDDEWYLVKELE
jgi:ribosomal protein S18 acetylase RimI-like enzyme